jgi:hypothetical protein
MRGGNLSLGLEDIRVDRGSVLGNPYEMNKDESNRDRVCEAYKHWLFANIKCWLEAKKRDIPPAGWGHIDPSSLAIASGLRIAPAWKQPSVSQVEAEFIRLCYLATQQNISLICWCFPKACHADVLRAALVWYHKTYAEECLRIELTLKEFFR